MKYFVPRIAGSVLLISMLVACSHIRQKATGAFKTEEHEEGEASEEYDGPGLAMQLEFEKTKDPVTGRVPRETLWPIIEYTDQLKQDIRNGGNAFSKATLNGWLERGPNSDSRASGNANLRGPNNDSTSGRIRAVMVDASDATGNTVWVGSVAGGLWKTTNITSRPAGWSLVNDKLSNLAITGICQNPVATSTIYICTGEATPNADAVQGDGIFKSTNGGTTWTQLSSTTGAAFDYCMRIVCDSVGNVYVGTRSGLIRSTDGGTSWTNITPTGISAPVCDIKISSTGRLHLTTGFGTTAYYRYTDIPATATTSAGWSSATTPFTTSGIKRVSIACQGSDLIALPSDNTTGQVSTIFKSSDGGANWTSTTTTPAFTNGQGWYCLAAAINPANTAQYMVGSLNCYKSTNSGSSWSQIADWSSGTIQYVHADQHDAIWYTAGSQSRALIVSDGGIFLSTDGGTTWSDRNTGLRIKQFYSCAIHPTASSNYILGGAQDNGCHALNSAGLGNSVEVTGGDGAFVHIDQDQPQYQFGSYVYNYYRRSTNAGASWNSITLNTTSGLFINPTDYDNTNNVMYCSEGASGYRCWTNPQGGSTSSIIAVTAFSTGYVYAVSVSPYTANRVFFGTNQGRLVMVDNANTVTSPAAGTILATGLGTISSITFGGSDDTVMVTSSSYAGTQVWYSTNATAASPVFTARDGSLPDMPVRWSLLIPNTYGKKVMLATETGVWVTGDITASAPAWVPDASFPNVRTTMLKYRPSDRTVAAATYGRGTWTAIASDALAIALPTNNFVLKGNAANQMTYINWTFKTARQAISFDIERSTDGKTFTKVASIRGGSGQEAYQYNEYRGTAWTYYRIRSIDQYGLTQYSNVISIAPGALAGLQVSNPFPNPAKDQLNLTVMSAAEESIKLELYNVAGQKLKNVSYQLSKGNQNISLAISDINPGNYLLQATIGAQRYSYLIVKQ